MKARIRKSISALAIFPVLCRTQKKRSLRLISVILVFAIINLTIGCRNYFKVTTLPSPIPETITGLKSAGKTIIIHFNEKRWVLSDVQIKDNAVTGKLNDYTYPPTLNPVSPKKPNRYLTRASHSQRYLLNEVHLYLDEFADMGNSMVSIPMGSISKVEIYDKDTATTVGSWVLGGLGITAGAMLVIGVIVALTKESCPFIYTLDGNNYTFAGEIYSGSIHQPLERNDYLKLPTYPGQPSYTLKITNEVKEIQHTNLLELLVIDHPADVNVLVDKYGIVTSLAQSVAPASATNLRGDDVLALVNSKDDLFYQSTSKGPDLPLKDGLILAFPGQGEAKTARIAIHAKNSIVLDYMLGQFHEMFGTAYKGYVKKQEKSSAARMRQWSLDQGIPLSLYVERDGKWDFVDYYNIAGPMKFKDDVLSVPLNGHETNPLKVKLEFGNFLWEIDYAAVDYSAERQFTVSVIPAKTAVNEEQKDVAGLLSKDDGNYYTQPAMDNNAVVTFGLPAMTDKSRTVILHSKGWYELMLNPDGTPDIDKLKTFRQPGNFNRFVNERLTKMGQQLSQVK